MRSFVQFLNHAPPGDNWWLRYYGLRIWPARSRAAALAACLRRNHNGNGGSAVIANR